MLTIYYLFLRNRRKLQNLFLTIASLFFYAWGEPLFVLVMIFSIIANWAFALWIDKVRDSGKLVKFALSLMVIANLSGLFIFKYLIFSIENINYIFGSSITIPNIILPIGISFFTFQAMSYVIDVYRKQGGVQKKPI